METHKYLIPGEGLTIRDPQTMAIIPAIGMMLPVVGAEGRFWTRRINDGTMKVGKPPAQTITKEVIK